jgi:hypothetical protein
MPLRTKVTLQREPLHLISCRLEIAFVAGPLLVRLQVPFELASPLLLFDFAAPLSSRLQLALKLNHSAKLRFAARCSSSSNPFCPVVDRLDQRPVLDFQHGKASAEAIGRICWGGHRRGLKDKFNARKIRSRAEEEPRVGVRGAPGVKRGLGGILAGPFCAAF